MLLIVKIKAEFTTLRQIETGKTKKNQCNQRNPRLKPHFQAKNNVFNQKLASFSVIFMSVSVSKCQKLSKYVKKMSISVKKCQKLSV